MGSVDDVKKLVNMHNVLYERYELDAYNIIKDGDFDISQGYVMLERTEHGYEIDEAVWLSAYKIAGIYGFSDEVLGTAIDYVIDFRILMSDWTYSYAENLPEQEMDLKQKISKFFTRKNPVPDNRYRVAAENYAKEQHGVLKDKITDLLADYSQRILF